MIALPPPPRPRHTLTFRPGDVVRHRRYGYRGVVVDTDPIGMHERDAWYLAERDQPDRWQPWYRVLVDADDGSVYAAHRNLVPVAARKPVRNPWIEIFFSGFERGRHVRNAVSWPG